MHQEGKKQTDFISECSLSLGSEYKRRLFPEGLALALRGFRSALALHRLVKRPRKPLLGWDMRGRGLRSLVFSTMQLLLMPYVYITLRRFSKPLKGIGPFDPLTDSPLRCRSHHLHLTGEETEDPGRQGHAQGHLGVSRVCPRSCLLLAPSHSFTNLLLWGMTEMPEDKLQQRPEPDAGDAQQGDHVPTEEAPRQNRGLEGSLAD